MLKIHVLFIFVFILVIAASIFVLIRFYKNNKNNKDIEKCINNTYRKRYALCKHPIRMFRIDDKLNRDASSLKMNPTIQEVVVNYPHEFTISKSYQNANLLLFETLNKSDQNINRLLKNLPHQLCFMNTINGLDLLVSKSTFASFMIDEACIPNTYIINQINGFHDFIHKYGVNNMYILKKNIQRQQGFYLSNSLDELIHEMNKSKDFVVCQKFLQNPYLINKRKINLRIYLLIVIDEINPDIDVVNSSTKWYVYQNGFLYYTPEFFEKNSRDQKKTITSGYIDRKIYEENPMTLQELNDFMGQEKYDKLYSRILDVIKVVKNKYQNVLSHMNKNIPGTKYSLFGCDIAPDENLHVKIMEINKGPDVSYKDDRDRKVKYNMMVDAFQVVGLINVEDIDKEIKRINQFREI